MKAKGYADHKGSSGVVFHAAGCSAVKRGILWIADHGGYYHRTAKSRRLARAAARAAWRNGEV